MRRVVAQSLCQSGARVASRSVALGTWGATGAWQQRHCATAATPGKIRVTVSSKIDGKTKTIEPPTGITLMEAIVNVAKFDMEAACDGTCACSTCHVIFEPESFDKLLDSPCEDEMDMLDLAPSVSRTSRLSCQVKLTPELDGIVVTIPDEMQNQMA